MPKISENLLKVGAATSMAQYVGSTLVNGSRLPGVLELLRSKGGQLYMAGPANNEFIGNSAAAPDGIGTDPIGYVRNLAAEELGPQRVPTPLASADWFCDAGWAVIDEKVVATNAGINAGAYPNTANPNLDAMLPGSLLEVVVVVESVSAGYFNLLCGGDASVTLAISAPGTYTRRAAYVAGATVYLQAKGFSGVISKVEVRTVRAAYQTTTSAKPKLVREPILGPELVVNGDFSDGTTAGWTNLTVTTGVSGGEATITSTVATGAAGIAQDLNVRVSVGKTYQLSARYRAGTATSNRVYVRRNDGIYTNLLQLADNATTRMRQFSGQLTLAYPDLTVVYACSPTAIGQTAVVDNISVREVLGYKDVWSWEFDGVDDKLMAAPPTITLSAGDFLCYAVTSLSTAPSGADISVRNDTGEAVLQCATANGRATAYISDGTTTLNLGNPPIPVPLGVPLVLTVWRDGGTWRVRMNGVNAAAVAVGAQVPVPAFTRLSVGGDARDVPSQRNARIQAPVICSGITTLAEVQQIERAVAAAAGVTLP